MSLDTSIQRHRAFVETVACGSLTKAAARLHCSQSSVSRMIADLEREWGVSLLRRDRTGVELTSDGESLLRASKGICDAYRTMREQVDEVRELATGHLRIGTISSVATHRLPDAIAAFRRDYPGIDYELLLGDYSDIERWLKEGRVDCGFLRAPHARGIDSVPYETDEMLAVMPEGHPLSQLEAIPLEAFCGEPFLALEHGADTEVAELFEKAGVNPDVALTTWDDYAIMAMVEKGLGLAILPSLILQRIPYGLAFRPLEPHAFRSLVFATKAGSSPSLALKRFNKYLIQGNALRPDGSEGCIPAEGPGGLRRPPGGLVGLRQPGYPAPLG